MRSKCINSISGREYLTENGFNDIDFLHGVKCLALRCCFFAHFGNFSLRMRSFDHISTSGLKFDVMCEFTAPIFL